MFHPTLYWSYASMTLYPNMLLWSKTWFHKYLQLHPKMSQAVESSLHLLLKKGLLHHYHVIRDTVSISARLLWENSGGWLKGNQHAKPIAFFVCFMLFICCVLFCIRFVSKRQPYNELPQLHHPRPTQATLCRISCKRQESQIHMSCLSIYKNSTIQFPYLI